jgi:hypothetical protein
MGHLVRFEPVQPLPRPDQHLVDGHGGVRDGRTGSSRAPAVRS